LKLAKEINAALLTSLTGKYALYIFQLLSLAIISRLFSPEVFGVVAAFQVFILFFQMLATSSLTSAVVYEETITAHQRNGIFSFSLCVGFTGSLIFYLITPSIANWLGIEDASSLSWVLAFNVLFSSLSMLPMASLQKDTKFLVVARAEIIAELLSFVGCVALYYIGLRLEALASKLMIVPLMRFVMYYHASASTSIGRPKFGKDIKQTYKLFAVAKYQMGFNVLNFFSRNLDTLLISKFFGVHLTGVYEKSYQLMRYPLQLFTFAITPALQPVFTKYKHSPQIIESEYYRIVFNLVLIGIFSSIVLFWKADEVVFILFGPQWNDTADILRILAVTIALQMVLSSSGGVFQAFGATREMFKCGVFSSVMNVSAIVLGVWLLDVRVLCFLLCISFLTNFLQCFYVLHKHIFKSKFGGRTYVLFSLVLVPYLNLFLVSEVSNSVTSYYSAIQDTGFFSLATAIIVGLIFVLSKRGLNKLIQL
tara:strand:- start:1818 stop:3257 length:1440 start_codon:yes stop_codon:yes gene_type:complete